MVVLRALTVLGLLGSAWVHLDLWLKGYRDIEIIGPLFMVNVVAGALIAGAVLLSRHWLPALGAILFGAATLGAFLLSATVGLFGVENESWGPSQIMGAATEVVCVLGGAALLDRRSHGRADRLKARSEDPTDGITNEFGPRPTDGIGRRVAEDLRRREPEGIGPQATDQFRSGAAEEFAPGAENEFGQQPTDGITKGSAATRRPRRQR